MEKLQLILKEKFMMDIFKEYRKEVPEFRKYWEGLFKRRQKVAHNRQSGAKVVYMKEAVHHIFNPVRQTDKDTKKRVFELGKTADSSHTAMR